MLESEDVQLRDTASATVGARVLALVGALLALLALGLPWARQDSTKVIDYETVLLHDGMRWTGWGLHVASRLDGQRPTSAALVFVLVGGSLVLVLGAWLSFELPRAAWLPMVMALIAAALLVGSFVATRHLAGAEAIVGTSDDDRTIIGEYGPAIWRIAMLAVLLATVRLGLLVDTRSWKM
jgi:hypothetical protein